MVRTYGGAGTRQASLRVKKGEMKYNYRESVTRESCTTLAGYRQTWLTRPLFSLFSLSLSLFSVHPTGVPFPTGGERVATLPAPRSPLAP